MSLDKLSKINIVVHLTNSALHLHPSYHNAALKLVGRVSNRLETVVESGGSIKGTLLGRKDSDVTAFMQQLSVGEFMAIHMNRGNMFVQLLESFNVSATLMHPGALKIVSTLEHIKTYLPQVDVEGFDDLLLIAKDVVENRTIRAGRRYISVYKPNTFKRMEDFCILNHHGRQKVEERIQKLIEANMKLKKSIKAKELKAQRDLEKASVYDGKSASKNFVNYMVEVKHPEGYTFNIKIKVLPSHTQDAKMLKEAILTKVARVTNEDNKVISYKKYVPKASERKWAQHNEGCPMVYLRDLEVAITLPESELQLIPTHFYYNK